MDIYSSVIRMNQNYKHRQAMSITMASGEVRKYTYSMLIEEANRYAHKLTHAGISKGDRIVLVAENSPAWQAAFLAIMQIHGTAVLIDANLPKELLEDYIQKADARCIFSSESVKEKLGDATAYRVPMFNLSKDGEVFKDSYNVLSPFINRTEDPMPEIAMIFFKGDSMRDVKAIMYSHRAMIDNVHSAAKENALSRSERILSLIPNSQIEGMVACVLSTMLMGASVHYVEALDYESLSRAFKTFKPTILPAPPAILKQLKEKLLEGIENEKYDAQFIERCQKIRQKTGVKLGSIVLKQLFNELGGKLELIWSYGPIEEEMMLFYYALGIDLLVQYGCLETNTPILGNRDDEVTLNTCGRPYPEMEVQLMHPNERGEGEIYIQSPYGMAGYFRGLGASENRFEEGWFKTGDRARLEDAIYVKVLYDVADQVVDSETSFDLREQHIKEVEGLPNKTNRAYYWFAAWQKAAQCLYNVTIQHEEAIPEKGGCIIYVPFETTKGYLGLTLGYSKERFFKFGYLTSEEPKERFKLEDEAFGKIHISGETLDEEAYDTCLKQLEKGWSIIVKAPKDTLNASYTEEIITLACKANVPIIPAYLEGEENVFQEDEMLPKLFDVKTQKRYPLSLRYGKPIDGNLQVNQIKKEIQRQISALIENQPQEPEEEPMDEITKCVLEMLSPGLGKVANKERGAKTIDSLQTYEPTKDEVKTEIKEETKKEIAEIDKEDKKSEQTHLEVMEEEDDQITERIDLKALLALEEAEEV